MATARWIWRLLWAHTVSVFSLREVVHEEGHVRLHKQDADKSAMYDPDMMYDFLTLLARTPQQRCGGSLRSVVPVSEPLEKQIRQRLISFFVIRNINGKKVLYGSGVGWKQFQDTTGHKVLGRLLQVGEVNANHFTSLMDLAALLRRTQAIRSLTFDFGIDLRDCWAGLEDLEHRPVCDHRSIADLAQDVADIHAKRDETGKSGSAIVTNMRRFIIKNFKDDENPDIVREVMPAIEKKLNEETRKHGGCYRTAIAPICAVLDTADINKRVHWSVMRKVELPKTMANRTTMHIPRDSSHDEVDFLDLKGPKFCGVRDGKSLFGDDVVWHRKDAGFVQLFPSGLPLRACGSREAAATLELDSELLRDLHMTDYSLFLVPHDVPSDLTCQCQHQSPRWPLVLDADPQDGPLRFAVGIIDYLERQVSFWDRWLHFSMSTMKEPGEYQNFWMRMWPMYFHLPRYEVKDGQVLLANSPVGHGQAVDELKPRRRVVALQKIKWRGEAAKYRVDLVVDGRNQKCYFAQIPEMSSSDAASGSKYKESSLFTPWFLASSFRLRGRARSCCSDQYAGKGKVFEVSPEQIMSWGVEA
ncbi:unnamed protein product [Symbiodinium natans]|uniref:Uncharacterized protein n=1 Tax=Symbiodinium natans TaxID=878477 RepID=A0A812RWU9_9DINO|nr:unnamed protein product [Symbiodinium natans]